MFEGVYCFAPSTPFLLLLLNKIQPRGVCGRRAARCDLPGTFPAALGREEAGFTPEVGEQGAAVLPEGEVSLETEASVEPEALDLYACQNAGPFLAVRDSGR